MLQLGLFHPTPETNLGFSRDPFCALAGCASTRGTAADTLLHTFVLSRYSILKVCCASVDFLLYVQNVLTELLGDFALLMWPTRSANLSHIVFLVRSYSV